MKNKLKIIKKVLKSPCYKCDSLGSVKDKACKVCKGTGIYKENYYYHITNGICFASEFIK